jgi:heparanase 1
LLKFGRNWVFGRNQMFGHCRASAIVPILAVALVAMAPQLGSSQASEQGPAASQPVAVVPGTMPRLGSVDERFQSFNIEMLEVTGGRFWKPYASKSDDAAKPVAAATADKDVPTGMDPGLYEYRKPIHLDNSRLRKLALALSPAYVRVSGTWANTTYFQDSDGEALKPPPAGFNGVLTREQWKGVVDFSHAAKLGIVTSFATSAGTRDASGVWTPLEAGKFLDYTRSAGGSIAAAEFMNEPTIAVMGGAPKGYDAVAFGRDVAVFRAYMKKNAPDTLLLGPGPVGEGGKLALPPVGVLKTEDLLTATGDAFDVFSYHFYGTVSERCARRMGPDAGTTAAAALSAEWLDRTDGTEAYYAALRDRFEPGKPLWITETADAACGGDPWAKTFLDSFRYLNQLGSMARRGVQVVMHNTLDASDYGLLDETTYEPRPNYWAALLWHKLMGRTVLDAGGSPSANLRLYAQCLRESAGGVALLAINADRQASYSLELPVAAERYSLSATELESGHVNLNGVELALGAEDQLPALKGAAVHAGTVTLEPATITFLAIPKAGNPACR